MHEKREIIDRVKDEQGDEFDIIQVTPFVEVRSKTGVELQPRRGWLETSNGYRCSPTDDGIYYVFDLQKTLISVK